MMGVMPAAWQSLAPGGRRERNRGESRRWISSRKQRRGRKSNMKWETGLLFNSDGSDPSNILNSWLITNFITRWRSWQVCMKRLMKSSTRSSFETDKRTTGSLTMVRHCHTFVGRCVSVSERDISFSFRGNRLCWGWKRDLRRWPGWWRCGQERWISAVCCVTRYWMYLV